MVPVFAPLSVVPVRGEGSRLWDQQGRDYIDFGAGVAVTSLGHAHPVLLKALQEQAAKVWHISNYYTNEPALRLAAKLCAATFAERVFFCNSGAEANEAALKLARKRAVDKYGPEKIDIIAFNGSFHGRTFFTVSVGGQAKYSSGMGPNPAGIVHIDLHDEAALRRAVGKNTCAIIVEPVVGESGVVPVKPEFLKLLRDLATEHDAALIFDEVQSGNGRTGALYAYMNTGVQPDILTTAKGLGGGFPIGAMLTTAAIADAHFTPGVHGSTFGGNPLACAVAEATFDIISSPEVLAEVRRKAAHAATRLRAIGEKYGCFQEVRESGLWLGCELKPEYAGRAGAFMGAAAESGVLVLVAGPNVVRIATSLVITDEELDTGLDRFDSACQRFFAA
ncbi:MAG: aspartate aminotransferase family protein [Candidatus Dactylopiibacterium carminicum]|uniref:Acetylornithine aminotransferase n=2 Tax=Candidatus Dactylopiibacterium carminicum TaxID=857335 RepID=A0A272ER83_9RHOO|nr:aspartate aminotransferase family protein [Candidatus Dactylopiibacterium carminicum]PAS92611.1 MAG: aspartate aminotransferase family protein [Candidatus Dactylopiibacterium carminicum]PAS93909.1 MAG: aspartate aminotransferase family protein [Candidatus Dactylopiibacterium carminicum]